MTHIVAIKFKNSIQVYSLSLKNSCAASILSQALFTQTEVKGIEKIAELFSHGLQSHPDVELISQSMSLADFLNMVNERTDYHDKNGLQDSQVSYNVKPFTIFDLDEDCCFLIDEDRFDDIDGSNYTLKKRKTFFDGYYDLLLIYIFSEKSRQIAFDNKALIISSPDDKAIKWIPFLTGGEIKTTIEDIEKPRFCDLPF